MNETIDVIKSLKTVRHFSDKEISDKNLDIILKACVNAATASARQSYSIVVVEDKSVMKEIGYSGSIMLVFCVDYNRLIQSAEYAGYKYITDTPVVDFITGSTDTILAAQTAAIAAKSIGIDSFFSNCVHRGDINRIYKLLELPEKQCFPLIALILGYEDSKFHKKTTKGRLSGASVIHYGKYKRASEEDLKNIMNEYDNEDKHFLSLISDWKEKGYEHYQDYFYEKWLGFPRKESADFDREAINKYSQVEEILRKADLL